MRFTLRFKLFTIVAVATAALILLTVWSGISERAVEAHVDAIRDTYLPKIRLRPQLQTAFEHLARTIQNAVEAADADLLAPASGERDAVVVLVEQSHDAMTVGQSAALRLAIEDYFDAALAVSRRLIASEGGETVTMQVQEMQAKRARVVALIEQTTAFDETALAAAFAATNAEQHNATFGRVVIGAACLLGLLALSYWIGAALFANVGALVAGFERFGRNDFATPIVPTSRDELSEVATRANRMAEKLLHLDHGRARTEWLRAGLAGLDDELRGELEPGEVARRTLAYLATYLHTPVGALYHGPPGGPYRLLGRHALGDAAVPTSVALGVGLVGQAATRTAITIIDGSDSGGLSLRSGAIDVAPRTLVLVPLASGGAVTGVLELAAVRHWRDEDTELLEQAGKTIAITLEVAHARSATRTLLAQTQQQARELERAGTYKSQFLANMSHELRTPLNAIIGFSEIMFDADPPLDAEMSHEYLGDIVTSGRHLLQLINDVLDLAKVESGKLEFFPEPLVLSRVVGEVMSVLKTTIAKQRITVTTEIDPAVQELVLDPARLKQVLYNYLSNALKFTPARGTIVVRAVEAGDARVRLEVIDSGSGIAPDQLGRLFADFHQTEDGARMTGGTGLGLAVTKRLVEAQGGEVGVTSEVGKGSTFHAILPRQAGAATAPILEAIVRGPTNASTILVVEDEPADRDQLVAALSAAGYSVEAVSTGAEAIARCELRIYDAITLDLLLPDMTGLEVLHRLREGKNGSVPVIVVTVVAERGAVAGFAVHDVLPKPLRDESLLASLHRAGVRADGGRSIVLVVDDDVASLKVMAASLGRLGYVAVCEQDPVRGLRAATEEPPSAIVLDLLMPGMTGFEFLEAFRVTPHARRVPVIVWTSKDLSSEELGRLRESADAVVAKGQDGNSRVLAELATFLPARST